MSCQSWLHFYNIETRYILPWLQVICKVTPFLNWVSVVLGSILTPALHYFVTQLSLLRSLILTLAWGRGTTGADHGTQHRQISHSRWRSRTISSGSPSPHRTRPPPAHRLPSRSVPPRGLTPTSSSCSVWIKITLIMKLCVKILGSKLIQSTEDFEFSAMYY